MPPKLLSKETVETINRWKLYRDPESIEFTREQATAYYRKRRFSETQIPNPPLPPAFIIPFGAADPSALDDLEFTDERQEFLKRTIPELQTISANGKNVWAGIKFLGEGGNAMVGLWKYGNINRHVVVKELLATNPDPQTNSLLDEGEIMQKLKQGAHMVKILVEPTVVIPRDEKLGKKWTNVVRRLLMEFCSLGSMEDLLIRRIQERKPFSELTLWKIFNCLIDGVTFLGAQAELSETLDPIPASDSEFVHFDLKPENIFMRPKNSSHPLTPVFKMGDFGHAMEFKSNLDWDTIDKRPAMAPLRDSGTPGYYTPEQFTAAWDYTGFQQNPMVGRYNWQTNVWGIGAIMYELATLSETPLNISQPFLPPGKPTAPAGGPFIAKGNSYGKNLDAYPYTDNFKITIWECLYENKEHRVTVLDLKRRAIQVMAAFETKGGKVDDYADLIPPEPKSALMVPDVPVLVACLCVAKLRAGQRKGRKCGRKAYPMTKKDINAGLARCLHHPIGAWPEVGK